MKKVIKMLVVLIVSVATIAGCATSKESDTITIAWYPNESGADLQAARTALEELISAKTGKQTKSLLTTDYNIAIEAIASGKAQIAFMGAVGYMNANNKNNKVQPLVIMSGKSGTATDAIYYSLFGVKTENQDKYKDGNSYSIQNIKGQTISFVSNSSTSGFKVPTDYIVEKFNLSSVDQLTENGKFFETVLYGGSHQGSAVNMLKGDADVAVFCDTCVANYVTLSSGTANEIGAQYVVNADAAEPFNTVTGDKFTLIASNPVLNAPFAINTEALSAETQAQIKELMLSDEILQNKAIMKDKGADGSALYTRESEKQKFIAVEDAFFDPLRKS